MVTALLALALACGLTPLTMVWLGHVRAVDIPNDRSSHDRPTLRGGGLAPVTASVVAVAASQELVGSPRIGVMLAATGMGLIGLVEDLGSVRLWLRFCLQLIAAVLALPWLLSGLHQAIGWQMAMTLLSLLWIVSYVNAYNFMDGIDGLSVAQAVVAGTAWFLIGQHEDAHGLATGGLILTGAALGFGPFNFPRARVFLGDVGSYGLGALVGALLVLGVRAGIAPEAMAAPVVLYLADTGSTLIRRAYRGEKVYLPHRDHTYQRLVHLGWSHVRTTLTVTVFLVACASAGALALTDSLAFRLGGDVAVAAFVATYLGLPALSARRAKLLTPR